MKYSLLVLLLMLAIGINLPAEEISLRRKDDMIMLTEHVSTIDNCEILFWLSNGTGVPDIYCQKVNALGEPVWDEPIPIANNYRSRYLVHVAPATDNGFFVMWLDNGNTTSNWLRIQKLSAEGQKLWGEDGILVGQSAQYIEAIKLIPDNNNGVFALVLAPGDHSVKGQHISASGALLWQQPWLNLVNSAEYLSTFCAEADGEGGFLVGLSSILCRYSAEGTVIGNNPLIPSGTLSGYLNGIKALPGGAFMISSYYSYMLWSDFYSTLILHKIDGMGNFLITSPSSYGLGNGDNYNLETNSNGDIYTNRYSSYNLTPLWLSKININMQSSWSIGLTGLVDNATLGVDNNGNAWITWAGHGTGNWSTKAQVVSPSGQQYWETGGKTITNSHVYPHILPLTGQGIYIWESKGGSDTTGYYTASIQLQSINLGGIAEYPIGGVPLVESTHGYAALWDTVALENSYLSLWWDSRPLKKIYYQITDTNMQNQLMTNGQALNPGSPDEEYPLQLLKSADGSVYVLYTAMYEGVDYDSALYLQKLSPTGIPLYPEKGVFIRECPFQPVNIKMGVNGSDIYVGWNVNFTYIMGQRISDGQKMWGANGRQIAITPIGTYCQLSDVQGAYYLWIHSQASVPRYDVKALLVDANGDPASGWGPLGINIVEDAQYLNQGYVASGIVNNDLVAVVAFLPTTVNIKRVQKISPNAQRLWQIGGVTLPSRTYNEDILHVDFDEEIAMLILDHQEPSFKIRFQMLSNTGQIMVAPENDLVAGNLQNFVNAQLVRYADGSYMSAFATTDLFYRMITPTGQIMGTQPSVLCNAPAQQFTPYLSSIGNQAFAAWTDNRYGGNGQGMAAIIATSIGSNFTTNEDPVLNPIAIPTIETNYPNPFNPSTTISFNIPESGKPQISIYNLKGQLIKNLLSNTFYTAGSNSVVWDGKDTGGRVVSSGIYFCRLSINGKSSSRKMVLAK